MVGPRYQDHVQERQRAVSAFDSITTKLDNYGCELPEIPSIHVKTTDLSDPILKYRAHMPAEKRLSRIIQQSEGCESPRLEGQERDTMNVRQWKILAECRCYHGAIAEPIKKGKRMLANTRDLSSISREIDCFGPFERRSSAYRKLPEWAKDHVDLSETNI
jgi:hypothetical protein